VSAAIFLAGTEIDALLSNAATTKSLTTWIATIRVCLKATSTTKWIATSGFISLALTATSSSGKGNYVYDALPARAYPEEGPRTMQPFRVATFANKVYLTNEVFQMSLKKYALLHGCTCAIETNYQSMSPQDGILS